MSDGDNKAAYAGDVDVQTAFSALQADAKAVLLDVRSDAEWVFVGQPNLTAAGKQPVNVAWQTFPGMKPNPDFVAAVRQAAPDLHAPVYCLCRSGGRSRAAAIALTAAGYTRAFNIAGGFEGDLDGARQRGRTGGWKAAGLPWSQS